MQLADALVGAISGRTPDFLQEVFADLAVRYTPEHVAYLRMVAAPGETLRSYGEEPSGDIRLGDFLPRAFLLGVEEAELVADQIGDDLHRDGLVRSRFGPAMNVTGLGPSEMTERGNRFLRYLTYGVAARHPSDFERSQPQRLREWTQRPRSKA
jgi:hypothetical protein